MPSLGQKWGWDLDMACVTGLRMSPSGSHWWLMARLWDCPSGESSGCFKSNPRAMLATFQCLCLHYWDSGAVAFIPTQASEAVINRSLKITPCLKYNQSQPMLSYCLQLSPSGNRQHQTGKNTFRFCSLLKYVMDLSQGIWEKQSRKLPECRAQPHSSSGASADLLVHSFPAFPRYWQVNGLSVYNHTL